MKDILDELQMQIEKFDNKAGLLITAVGIIFGFSLTFFNYFDSKFFDNKTDCFKNLYTAVFFVFILSLIVSLFLFIRVIYPRKNRTKKKYPNYYWDITLMKDEELKEVLSTYGKEVDGNDYIFGQIKINASICKKKHRCFASGVIVLIPMVICLLFLLLMLSGVVVF